MGVPAAWNVVVAMVLTSPKPPLTYFGFIIQPCSVCSACVIGGSLNLTWWLTHWSYTSPPASRSTISSSQSVAGQPVAVPEPMPPHHGLVPGLSAAILSLSAIRSAQLVGTWYPAAVNAFGEYHTSDFML